ncbi:MAG TPA: site-2 protease family protein [Mycobacteriales bacterium]|nr:site-2 protease family protein [Mycobacteriales bacterium]
MDHPAPDAHDPASEPLRPPPELTGTGPDAGYTVPPGWSVPHAPPARPQSKGKRALGPLAGAGVALAKWGAILLKLKALTLFGSVAISIAAYTVTFGFTFAVAFVGLIFVHEMGHFIYFGVRGMKPRLPVFLPFLGAYTTAQKAPVSVLDEALSGLAGPALGMVAAGLAGWRAEHTHSSFLYAVAFIGFFLNLLNLIPLLPFDGGHAAVALHPAVSAVGVVFLVLFELRHPSLFLLVFLVLGVVTTWQRFQHKKADLDTAYHVLTRQQRFAIAGLYIALIAIGLWGESHFYLERRI